SGQRDEPADSARASRPDRTARRRAPGSPARYTRGAGSAGSRSRHALRTHPTPALALLVRLLLPQRQCALVGRHMPARRPSGPSENQRFYHGVLPLLRAFEQQAGIDAIVLKGLAL